MTLYEPPTPKPRLTRNRQWIRGHGGTLISFPVLTAIGLTDEAAMGSIRIGLGKANTAEEMDMLVNDLERAVARLREISAA